MKCALDSCIYTHILYSKVGSLCYFVKDRGAHNPMHMAVREGILLSAFLPLVENTLI